MIKKILLFVLLFVFSFSFVWLSYSATRDVWSEDIKKVLLDISSDNVVKTGNNDWFETTASILIWAKDSLTSVIVLIAVWAFLFIWIKLAFARGNPEEFKKAMMQLVYAIVWVFVVSIAWAVVRLVAGIHL